MVKTNVKWLKKVVKTHGRVLLEKDVPQGCIMIGIMNNKPSINNKWKRLQQKIKNDTADVFGSQPE